MEKISRSAIRRFDAFGEFEDEMGDEDKDFEDAGDPRLFEDCISYEEEVEDEDKDFEDAGDPRLFEDCISYEEEVEDEDEEFQDEGDPRLFKIAWRVMAKPCALEKRSLQSL